MLRSLEIHFIYRGECHVLFALEALKKKTLNGHLLFTDAVETGEDIGGKIVITDSTREGVDMALLQARFRFIPEASNSPAGMYLMVRNGNERLLYHPIRSTGYPPADMALDQNLATRIDFFCHSASNAAFDVVTELLCRGYRILTFLPESKSIKNWYLLSLDEIGNLIIKEVA